MRQRLAAIPGVDNVSVRQPARRSKMALMKGPSSRTRAARPSRRRFAGSNSWRRRSSRPSARLSWPAGISTWPYVYDHRLVVLVSENLARQHWRTPEAALGKHIRENPTSPWREIVGVATDVHDDGMQRPAPPTVYLPVLLTNFWGERVLVWRNVTFADSQQSRRQQGLPRRGATRDLGGSDQRAGRTDPDAGRTCTTARWRRRRSPWSCSRIAGTIALVLGIIGIYGVIAYAVHAAHAGDWHPARTGRAARARSSGCSSGRASS